MRAAIVRFPGTVDEQHVQRSLTRLGFTTVILPHTASQLEAADLLVLPGGAAYGNYIRPGAIARLAPIREAAAAFVESGGLVLGLGNGFHILTEWELLPGVLVANPSLRFQCRAELIRVERTDTPFTGLFARGEILSMPISSAYGSYQLDQERLAELEKRGQVVFRYVENPNNSVAAAAGIVSEKGNVLGMLPQPDAAAMMGSACSARFCTVLRGG